MNENRRGATRRAGRPPAGPFWAPTPPATVEAALDLAELGSGERFLDVGCGDGRALEAAVRRGAVAFGVESDADLADSTRRRLAAAGFEATVIDADFFAGLPSADVIFAFLTPATLQRLRPAFDGALGRAGRLVTYGFAVPGLVVDAEASDHHLRLYRAPLTAEASGEAGWGSFGTIAAMPSGRTALVPLRVVHPGGPVSVGIEGALSGRCALWAGTDHARPGERVAVDLTWVPSDEEPASEAQVTVTGLPPHPVLGLATDRERSVVHVREPVWTAAHGEARSWSPGSGLAAFYDRVRAAREVSGRRPAASAPDRTGSRRSAPSG